MVGTIASVSLEDAYTDRLIMNERLWGINILVGLVV